MQLGRVPIETVTLRTGHGAPVDQCRWQELRAGLYTPHREVLRLLDPGQLTDSLKPELSRSKLRAVPGRLKPVPVSILAVTECARSMRRASA